MRFVFLDVARAAVMAILIFDHGMIAMGVVRVVPDPIKFLCFAATPAFVIHFGVMLELVYVRRRAAQGAALVRNAFLKRAAQCYLGYVLVLAAGYLSGRMPTRHFPGSLIFLGTPWFSDILKFYCLFLLGAPLLLALRARFGVWATAAALVAPWLLSPLLPSVSWPRPTSALAAWTGLLFGMPTAYPAALCLMKGMLFIAAGMLMGNALAQGKHFGRIAAALFVLGAAAFTWMGFAMGWDSMMPALMSRKLRLASHPAYYAFALAEGTLLFAILYRLVPSTTSAEARATPYTAFARWPLLTFTLANFIATFFPRIRRPSGWEMFAAVVFMIAIAVGIALWDYRQRARAAASA